MFDKQTVVAFQIGIGAQLLATQVVMAFGGMMMLALVPGAIGSWLLFKGVGNILTVKGNKDE